MDTPMKHRNRKTGSFKDYAKGPCSLKEYCESDDYLYSVEPLSIFRLNLLFEDLELDSSFDLHDAFDSVLVCDSKYEMLQKSLDDTYRQIDALYKVLRTLQDRQRAVALKKALIQERIKVHFSIEESKASNDCPFDITSALDEFSSTLQGHSSNDVSKENDSSES